LANPSCRFRQISRFVIRGKHLNCSRGEFH
jgi:hypothetical protein